MPDGVRQMHIQAAVAVLAYYRNLDSSVTFLFPIICSIGITFSTFLFVLNYLSSQPERISFIVKISGTVLTTMLAMFGTIPWLITPPYADHYEPSVMALDHRTIHFRLDENGGYVADKIPFQW